MIFLYIFILPLLFGLLAWVFKNKSLNNALVFAHSFLHLGAALALILPGTGVAQSLGIDDLSSTFFLLSAILYFAVGIYSLKLKTELDARQSSVYAICLMLFVASMDGANLSRDLGLIWVFVETTTLASAMLISFERARQSLEAAWKYLFICSVGIAIAFVGILLLIIAQPGVPSLNLDRVLALTASLSPFWLKLSFVFILVGFGTKIGLAPMHFWLPDAHSEAPAAISALLSGALLNTALLPLLRIQTLMNANGLGAMAAGIFLIFGFLSVFVAAVFIVKIKNYKRLLAYSSIENMGIILIAFSLGDLAGKAGLIHIMGHSLIKAAFFLTAGNIYSIYHQKDSGKCGGLLDIDRASGWLWLIAFAFIIGMPPSPLFLSELYIVIGLLAAGNVIGVVIFFILLAAIAWGLGKNVLKITMGKSERRETLPLSRYLPQMGLLLSAVALFVYLIK